MARRRHAKRLVAGFLTGLSSMVLLIGDALASEAGNRPNFLIIVADDLGYSDLGAFGGEIGTPNLDQLALSGARFTNFHAGPACAPSRAALLTGKDPHLVGQGSMGPAIAAQAGKPGYVDYLNDRYPTVALQLSHHGYFATMVGKWHLGAKAGQGPESRGFARSFAVLEGASEHILTGKTIFHGNGHPVKLQAGGYSSDLFADRLIDSLRHSGDKPFLAYLAFTAPHWPLQAEPKDIELYKNAYDSGPAVLGQRRFASLVRLGLIDRSVIPHPPEASDDWQTLSADVRQREARKMEIYAAMVHRMDVNVGRVIEYLRSSKKLDQTYIIFLSDNGAAGHYGDVGGRWGFEGLIGPLSSHPDIDNSVESLGSAKSFIAYGEKWAAAATVPFRLFKSYTTEGGIRVPAFVFGPGIKPGIVSDFADVRDIAPTILSLANVSPEHERQSAWTSTGRSQASVLLGGAKGLYGHDDSVGWEFYGGRALRRGQWKITYVQKQDPFARLSWAPGKWELFNIKSDPGEVKDLSDKYPVLFKSLINSWYKYASANDVVVLFDERKNYTASKMLKNGYQDYGIK